MYNYLKWGDYVFNYMMLRMLEDCYVDYCNNFLLSETCVNASRKKQPENLTDKAKNFQVNLILGIIKSIRSIKNEEHSNQYYSDLVNSISGLAQYLNLWINTAELTHDLKQPNTETEDVKIIDGVFYDLFNHLVATIKCYEDADYIYRLATKFTLYKMELSSLCKNLQKELLDDYPLIEFEQMLIEQGCFFVKSIANLGIDYLRDSVNTTITSCSFVDMCNPRWYCDDNRRTLLVYDIKKLAEDGVLIGMSPDDLTTLVINLLKKSIGSNTKERENCYEIYTVSKYCTTKFSVTEKLALKGNGYNKEKVNRIYLKDSYGIIPLLTNLFFDNHLPDGYYIIMNNSKGTLLPAFSYEEIKKSCDSLDRRDHLGLSEKPIKKLSKEDKQNVLNETLLAGFPDPLAIVDTYVCDRFLSLIEKTIEIVPESIVTHDSYYRFKASVKFADNNFYNFIPSYANEILVSVNKKLADSGGICISKDVLNYQDCALHFEIIWNELIHVENYYATPIEIYKKQISVEILQCMMDCIDWHILLKFIFIKIEKDEIASTIEYANFFKVPVYELFNLNGKSKLVRIHNPNEDCNRRNRKDMSGFF